jgi:hypothetical protein
MSLLAAANRDTFHELTGEDILLSALESEDGPVELESAVYVSISGIFNSIAFRNDEAKQVCAGAGLLRRPLLLLLRR